MYTNKSKATNFQNCKPNFDKNLLFQVEKLKRKEKLPTTKPKVSTLYDESSN